MEEVLKYGSLFYLKTFQISIDKSPDSWYNNIVIKNKTNLRRKLKMKITIDAEQQTNLTMYLDEVLENEYNEDYEIAQKVQGILNFGGLSYDSDNEMYTIKSDDEKVIDFINLNKNNAFHY